MMRILFFIESLISGGKERRFVELLEYLKNRPGYDLKVVLARNEIHYPKFLKLGIPWQVIERKGLKRDPRLFTGFYRICREFNPDGIHAWGNMSTFYALPSKAMQRTWLINSQIADAYTRPGIGTFAGMTMRLNFRFSDRVTSNSRIGLHHYGIKTADDKSDISNGKYRVIYNGINLDRFENLPDKNAIKARFGLHTPYAIVMVGTFTHFRGPNYRHKDYQRLVDVVQALNRLRQDVTCFAVGDGPEKPVILQRVQNEGISNMVFTGEIPDVEALLSICDAGVLFSNRGEGISNALMEYMASGLPVVADGTGGTPELVRHKQEGLLLSGQSPETVAQMISDLIDNKRERKAMGDSARKRIETHFTIKKMGMAFESLYREMSA